MLRSKSVWLVVVCCLLTVLLALPMTGAAKEEHGAKHKEMRAQLMKDLNLSAEQSKQLTELEEKFSKQRLDLYQQLHKGFADLKQAMAAKPANEKKVADAVAGIVEVKDKLMDNYQKWWHEEVNLLKPEQKGHYLMAMNKWWKEIMTGHCMKEMSAEESKK